MNTSFDARSATPQRTVREFSAGGVIYRGAWPDVDVALTMPRHRPIWTLPKGMIEPGETPEQAAVREVREESGLSGRIVRELLQTHYTFYTLGRTVRIAKSVRFYLMECLGGNTDRHDREVVSVAWFRLADALSAVAYRGERDVLHCAADAFDPSA